MQHGIGHPRAMAKGRSRPACIVVSSFVLLLSATAIGQDRYAGTWTIASSEPAPWPHEAGAEVPKEIAKLTGATVALKADRIEGPRELACRKPHYKLRQDGAEMLFQGALAEYGDRKTTPEQAATKLGFSARPITTIETGCANELEFHAIDGGHLVFGLNNRVYRLVRAKPAAGPASPASSR